MRKIKMWSLGVIGFVFAISFGRWSQSLFTQSESVHFSVNFPTGGGAQTMSCCDLGGPWANNPEQNENDYPAGGVLTWGREGEIVVDVGKEGFLKRTLQPGFLNLSTHWLRNVGTRPYQIGLEMEMCGLDLEWDTFESSWDPVSQTFTRLIEPGKVVNMDWYITIPPDDLDQSTICEGQLKVLDAQNQSLVTTLPIKIINSRVQE